MKLWKEWVVLWRALNTKLEGFRLYSTGNEKLLKIFEKESNIEVELREDPSGSHDYQRQEQLRGYCYILGER